MHPVQAAATTGRALVCSVLLLTACGDDPVALHELSGTAMGTQFTVQIPAPLSEQRREDLQQAIDDAIARVEQATSTYLLESELSRFNASRSTDWFLVSEEVCAAVREAIELSELTGGAFDLTVGPLVNLWGFGPDTVRLQPPEDADVEAMRERVGYQRLHTDCDRPALRKDMAELYVDLSAYAKGLAVDSVSELLREMGHEHYLVDVGGDMRVQGTNARGEPWAIAIETPEENGRGVQRVLPLREGAVATSGDYRNYFEFEGQRYSHVIDARSGRPPTHALASVTVVADNAAYADAMATALLVLGPGQGMELAEREDIAAVFQLRSDERFAERLTPAFQELTAAD